MGISHPQIADVAVLVKRVAIGVIDLRWTYSSWQIYQTEFGFSTFLDGRSGHVLVETGSIFWREMQMDRLRPKRVQSTHSMSKAFDTVKKH